MLCSILKIYAVGFVMALVTGAIDRYKSPVKYRILDAIFGVITFAAFWFFTIPLCAIDLPDGRNAKQNGGAPC